MLRQLSRDAFDAELFGVGWGAELIVENDI
jgi:hypothetical protein